MKINFKNLSERFSAVMPEFLEEKGIACDEGGICAEIFVTGGNGIKIEKKGNRVKLELGKEGMVFRAVSLLIEHKDESDLTYSESCRLDTCGFLYDGSQANSVLTVESCKKLLRVIAGMGFNMMMLYCEDCYEVPLEPNWSNMRPRYTQEEFKEIDDYAYSLGIEMIPCIQTLAHLKEVLKKADYRCVADTAAVLMVGEERTYELIDHLISAISSCFRSKRIHLNMDEAWDLGLGEYLKKNGYKTKHELMKEHLSSVMKITRKYGLTPMMWSDMFFRDKCKQGYYLEEGEMLGKEDQAAVPEDMDLVYWDYWHKDEENYERMIKAHMFLKGSCWFAAACRSGRSFGASYNSFFKATVTALRVCKRTGVKNAFICQWGDNHRESSVFSILPQLQTFAEYVYGEEPSQELIAKRFEASTSESWEAFRTYDGMDCVPEYNGINEDDSKISRYCMWQDIMLGLFDFRLRGMDFSEHYEKLAEKFKKCTENSKSYSTMFGFAEKTAKVLSLKAYMGIRLVKAYKSGDREELELIAQKLLPQLQVYMQELRKTNRSYFFETYKPLGWEVLDIRYGGAIARIDTAIMRITDYLDGKISKIDELEENRIDMAMFHRNSILSTSDYYSICSPSSL